MRTATSILGICMLVGLASGASAQADAKKTLTNYGYESDFPQRVSPVTDTHSHTPLLKPVKLAPSTEYRPDIVIQVGAFSDYTNARRRAEKLSGFGPTRIVDSDEFGRRLYRVYLGDFRSRTDARPVLSRIKASGYDGFVKTP